MSIEEYFSNKNRPLRILSHHNDTTRISDIRSSQPMAHLSGHGVVFNYIRHLPRSVRKEKNLPMLVQLVSQYDLFILQRCHELSVAQAARNACDLAGVPLILEVDDDYMNVPDHNEASKFLNRPSIQNNYGKIIEMADGVTVSTQEIADTLYQFNKNIKVLPNNMVVLPAGEFFEPRRDLTVEQFDVEGKVSIQAAHGHFSIPAFRETEKNGVKGHQRLIRVGYSATRYHREDCKTINNALQRILKKYHNVIFVTIGDEIDKAQKEKGEIGCHEILTAGLPRCVQINTTPNFRLYYDHLRNIDIGIAPLLPDMFNMSKSPMKALEYASYGIPSVLPNFVTYTREFTHKENCLLYNNEDEFYTQLEKLILDHNLRQKLGEAARDRVRDYRMEYSPHNIVERLDFYNSFRNRFQLAQRGLRLNG